MAGNTRFISFNDINKHPDDSILLAYLRGQNLEFRSSVIQHIDVEKCPCCLQKLNELKQISATLDVLGDMRPYQHYPELSVADTYARMQTALNHRIPAKTASNGAYNRQRPRKSAVRLISVPAAFGLAILFTMTAVFVFASFSGRAFNPFSPAGGIKPGPNTLTMVVQAHTTATPGVNGTATIVTPGAKEPHIRVCSTQTNIAPMQLIICGFNFDSKHKANLLVDVPGKGSFWIRTIPVDRHGKFQAVWSMADCSNVPTSISGYETTGTGAEHIKVKLQITSFGSCPVSTTASAVKPSGFLSNFVP